MSESLATPLVFFILFLLFFTGAPVFLCLAASGVLGIFLLRGTGMLFQSIGAIYAQIDSFILIAIPLFILMGQIIIHTGVATSIYDLMSKWLHRLPGGLAIASIYTCAVFGAMCGVSIAGVAAIGGMAIPEMTDRGYNREFAVGAVAAAGALAILIPPSVAFIIYGEIAEVSVGKLFMGGVVPGLVLATMMAIYVLLRVVKNPSLAPPVKIAVTWGERFAALRGLWSPIALVLAVMGTIYTGISTPTESAAMGVAGALAIAAYRKKLDWEGIRSSFSATTRITGALMVIIGASMVFSGYLSIARIPDRIAAFFIGTGLPPIGLLFMMMILLIIAGMFVDAGSVIILTTPLLLPLVIELGFDPLHYGILVVINCEMAMITPPVGLNLFTVKALFKEIELAEIIRGAAPYVLIEFLCLVLFILVPQLALWLPGTMG